MSEDFELRLTSLEARVAALEPTPVTVTVGVCRKGTPDPSVCQYASLYQRRKGCDGAACVHKSSEYYKAYRRVAEADEA